MSTISLASSPVSVATPGAFSLLLRRPVAAICLAVVGLYVALALLTFLPAFDNAASRQLAPLPGSSATEYIAPSFQQFPDYLLGTDIQNRSVFYRVLYGCRTALIITLFTSMLALGIGVTLGVLAGYFGGTVDELINWLLSTVSAVPWILLVLSLGFVVKGANLNPWGLFGYDPATGADAPVPTFIPIPDLAVIVLAMGLTDWVGICRLIRGEVLKQRALDYVSAGLALGLSKPRILFRHILPNCFHLVIITFTLGAVGYVQVEVALTFLGLGITDKPSWGRMIDDAKLELLRGVWWQFAAATVMIGGLCLALSLLGDALRDVLDPKTRSRR